MLLGDCGFKGVLLSTERLYVEEKDWRILEYAFLGGHKSWSSSGGVLYIYIHVKSQFITIPMFTLSKSDRTHSSIFYTEQSVAKKRKSIGNRKSLNAKKVRPRYVTGLDILQEGILQFQSHENSDAGLV